MYTTSPDPIKKLIEEYDFSFTNGMMLPITIDREAGDEVDLSTHPHAIIVNIVEKPSRIIPDQTVPAEQITIFTAHLLSIQKRIKEVEELTFEQKEQFRLTVQELSTKTIQ